MVVDVIIVLESKHIRIHPVKPKSALEWDYDPGN